MSLHTDVEGRTAGGARPLVGRDTELALLGTLVAAVEHGGTAVGIRGAPGVGKSALLHAVTEIARGRGCQVLAVAGAASESALAFAGLQQLLGPLLADLDGLPTVQRRALRRAIGIDDGPPPELFLVALATLNLITESATRRPIIVVVDDGQWLDRPTEDVLAFLARRVEHDAVLIVGARRPGHETAWSSLAVHDVELAPLDDAASRELLARSGVSLSRDDTAAILTQAAGNPLALVELPAVWRRTAANHSPRRPPSPPLSTRLTHVFGARIGEMPALTRDTLLVAAVGSSDDAAEILAGASVLAGHEVSAAALDPAERAQIVEVDDGHVRFRHPLVRATVVHLEPPSRRRAAHAALSDVLRSDPDRRTWHRALRSSGPDDVVADELEVHHHESIRRGSFDAAISALERSAQLSTDPSTRVRRLLLAARHAYGMGRPAHVDRLVTRAEQGPLTTLDRARVEWLRELVDDGGPDGADRTLERCAAAQEAADHGDAALALDLLLAAALRCSSAGAGPGPRAQVVAAAERIEGAQDDPRCVAAIALAEPIARGTQTITRLSRVRIETISDADDLRLLGLAARAVGADPRAAAFLGRAETKLRGQGRSALLAQVLAAQSAVWLDLGDFGRARACTEEARHLARDTAQATLTDRATTLAARIAGLTGDVEQALQQAEAGEVGAPERVDSAVWAEGQLARGCAWISAGRHAEAHAVLKQLFDPSDPHHHQREQLSGVMFLAEAAVRSDQRDGAREIVARVEALATVTTSPILHMHLLYARAVLADPSEADTRFREALDHDLTSWPWVRARLQLAYGSWLRRQRRVAQSRDHLRAAAATLELIGATAWVREATSELRAAGEPGTVRRSGAAAAPLSPQELQIAHLAADGLSNREIGERLYLSPRTVSSHLYRIFPKLGIRTRAQLASRLALEQPAEEQHSFGREAQRRVRRPERLAAVRATGLLDTPPEVPFDRLTALAAELLEAPYAFVTIVDDSRSFWKSCFGDVGGARQNAVGDSFCQYVIGVDGPLLIGDARTDDRTAANPSIESMGVVAWAGHPIRDRDGEVLGTFCVVDTRPREWTAAHGRMLEAMASAAAGEINVRAAAVAAAGSAARLAELGRFARRMSGSVTPAEIGSSLAGIAGPLFGATSASLVLVGAAGEAVAVHPVAVGDGRAVPVAALAMDAMQTGVQVRVRDRAEWRERYPDLVSSAERSGVAAALAEPLVVAGGRVSGAIALGWSTASGCERIDRELYESVLELCRNAIDRAHPAEQ